MDSGNFISRVTNGTSTSNKMVWHHTVAPGDVVVVDRNCHKSILPSAARASPRTISRWGFGWSSRYKEQWGQPIDAGKVK